MGEALMRAVLLQLLLLLVIDEGIVLEEAL